MSERYDIAIIGSGPAGLSAALNAQIRNKRFIMFGNRELSNKLLKAPKVNNYLGFYGVNGEDLKNNFREHIKSMGIGITEEKVNAIYSMGTYFVLMVNDKAYEASSVIIATGIEYQRPLKGEEEYLGKGVGYCATCDAPLYKERKVTIISYSKDGEKEANYVNELADKVIYIPMYEGEHNLDDTIEVVKDKPIEVRGTEKVEKLLTKNGEINTDGVFILRESISPSQLVPGLKIEDNHIEVNRKMETNIKGCFAAGDCVGTPYQYIKAAGEGNIAALSAVNYLNSL